MIPLDRLGQIIPPDIALANKALATSLQQITGAQKLSLPAFANVVSNVTTMADLPIITALTQPVPTAVKNYFTQTTLLGSGTCGQVKLVDIIGTIIGWVMTTNLNNTITTCNAMNLADITDCYTKMVNTENGDYDYHVPNPAYDPFLPPGPGNLEYLGWQVVIPGYGTYPGSPVATQILARNAGIAALITAANTIISGYQTSQSANATKLQTYWTSMVEQSQREINNQAKATLVYGNLIANETNSVRALVNSLPGYSTQTQQGGPYDVMEQLSDVTVITGTVTAGSAVITAANSTVGIAVTGSIGGYGIPNATTVTAVGSGTITMSRVANATAVLNQITYGTAAGAQTGQAVVGVLRQGKNQEVLNNAGIGTNSNMPQTVAETQATFIPSTYTEPEARRLVIK
jgi:hypothetical protein